MPITPTKKIWMDGEFVDWDDAKIHILNPTLHYGWGVFEGIRAYETDRGPAVFRLTEHIDRLFRSAHLYMMKPAFTAQQLVDVTTELVRINEVPSCYIRPLLYLGYGEMGLNPLPSRTAASIACWPWGAYLGEEALKRGIRAKISSYVRFGVNAMMTKGKIVGHYVNSVLAKREAKSVGYDEAIMLDTQGLVAEGTGENVFIVKRGILKTTPLSASILQGITRDSIIRLARDLGLTVLEQQFTRDEMYIADEVFMTGTAAELTPVREIDDRQIGSGSPGPVTRRLQDAFFSLVRGPENRYPEWLTYL